MSADTLLISKNNELLALHRALLEARFCDVPNDPDVSASPILASIHARVIETLIQTASPEKATSWKHWLAISQSRREWRVAVQRAADHSRWGRFTLAEKLEMARTLLTPFDIAESDLVGFVGEADAACGK